MTRFRTAILIAVASSIFSWAPLTGSQPEQTDVADTTQRLILMDENVFPAEIVRVVSGDTVVVSHSDTSMTVCLAGVDAPDEGQSFASEAHQHVSNLLLGKAVTVRLRGLDAPARCDAVGRVFLQGEDMGKELLQAGLAWYCDRSALPNSALPEAEATAKASERGLWSDPEPVPPWVFRGVETCLEEDGA